MTDRSVFWAELDRILDAGFTGSLVLHCGKGRIIKTEKHEMLHLPDQGTDRPRETEVKSR